MHKSLFLHYVYTEDFEILNINRVYLITRYSQWYLGNSVFNFQLHCMVMFRKIQSLLYYKHVLFHEVKIARDLCSVHGIINQWHSQDLKMPGYS